MYKRIQILFISTVIFICTLNLFITFFSLRISFFVCVVSLIYGQKFIFNSSRNFLDLLKKDSANTKSYNPTYFGFRFINIYRFFACIILLIFVISNIFLKFINQRDLFFTSLIFIIYFSLSIFGENYNHRIFIKKAKTS